MNEISVNVSELEVAHIVKNCLDRNFWNRKWEVFNYGKLRVYIELYSILTIHEKVEFRITVEDTDSTGWLDSRTRRIEIPMREVESFEEKHREKIIRNIFEVLVDFYKFSGTYDDLALKLFKENVGGTLPKVDNQFIEKIEENILEILKRRGIKNNKMINNYIKKATQHYAPINKTTFEILTNLKEFSSNIIAFINYSGKETLRDKLNEEIQDYEERSNEDKEKLINYIEHQEFLATLDVMRRAEK